MTLMKSCYCRGKGGLRRAVALAIHLVVLGKQNPHPGLCLPEWDPRHARILDQKCRSVVDLTHPSPPGHRQPCGPSGPDRPPPGQLCDAGPRSSFWERSHTALGRLRYRGKPHEGRGHWGRGGRGGGRGRGRFVSGENHGNRKESPSRKQKLAGRPQGRQPMYNSAKAENGVDETFEDLLMKYKQIQLELECIRKEERKALDPIGKSPPKETEGSGSVKMDTVLEIDSVQGAGTMGTVPCEGKVEKKAFQAFNLKPLRQKLPTPAERDAMNLKTVKEAEESPVTAPPVVPNATTSVDELEEEEEEEADLDQACVSSTGTDEPLVLPGRARTRMTSCRSCSSAYWPCSRPVRSGSRKSSRQGQNGAQSPSGEGQGVVKTHPAKKNISPGSAAKQAWRKQQLRTWKQQQLQKVQEEQRVKLEEEEERRKREDEIRKIRDLSNQDEQYNRFMRLVGGKRRSRSKSVDGEHRKSLCKPGLDTSGNLYQYDNYDEVAMDTDSEAGSPASSPVHDALCIAGLPFTPRRSPSLWTLRLTARPQLKQPPKPPFADEEEEEEMLLREELLKSLANKRAVRSEDTSSNSAPPSPPVSLTPFAQPSRANLAAPSQSRAPGTKFSRAHPPPRLPLVLPRHKAVVVQLNGSDDSDSESEAPGPAHMAFGGLEFMIKEARRTAEAAKPKGSSASEKENNPMKTPEALPDAKKIEYRRLKAEIASREKQQVWRSDAAPLRAPLDAEVDSASRAAAERQVAEAESKLAKHRDLLLRDELLLKHLLQQEQRKRESLRAAEAKVTKLKEQLLASEKIAGANRVLLKKLEEQVHRVQHRVSIKKHQALKLERDLSQARAAVGRGGVKRRNDPAHVTPGKLPRLGGPLRASEQQFAELIAQKRRLQQLESEYALKIQKLKEAQALRHRGTPPLLPPAPSPGPAPFPLPQPSMHDLTQDKLTLASEDTNEAEAEEQSPAEVSPGKPAKPAATSNSPELLLGLNLEDLRRRYEESERLDQLMQRSLLSTGGAVGKLPLAKEIPVDVELLSTPTARGELKPTPFGPYHSPLLLFRSYRFSPYFRTKEKLSLSSVSYSNSIEPEKSFCRFDLTGTCNDDACPWQHMRNCTLNATQLFQDVLSYSLPLIGCSESSSDQDISVATEKYISKLFGSNKDRMGTDQKAVLLVSKVNENRGHVPPHTTYKEARKWRPRPAQNLKPEAGRDSCDEESTDDLGLEKRASTEPLWLQSCALDVCVTQDDERYFTNETDDISNLETSVLESPRDVQLWIKLAYKYLSQKER
ncbi:hypothetical protein GJAV_G00268960 [Gymnothorax javanicus]|nr:hypothetical protein GJAV_G00268960 [Gymnothorax javanicus]